MTVYIYKFLVHTIGGAAASARDPSEYFLLRLGDTSTTSFFAVWPTLTLFFCHSSPDFCLLSPKTVSAKKKREKKGESRFLIELLRVGVSNCHASRAGRMLLFVLLLLLFYFVSCKLGCSLPSKHKTLLFFFFFFDGASIGLWNISAPVPSPPRCLTRSGFYRIPFLRESFLSP